MPGAFGVEVQGVVGAVPVLVSVVGGLNCCEVIGVGGGWTRGPGVGCGLNLDGCSGRTEGHNIGSYLVYVVTKPRPSK